MSKVWTVVTFVENEPTTPPAVYESKKLATAAALKRQHEIDLDTDWAVESKEGFVVYANQRWKVVVREWCLDAPEFMPAFIGFCLNLGSRLLQVSRATAATPR